MLYRDIPFALFNAVKEEDSLRPFDPPGSHYGISQMAKMRSHDATLIYESSDFSHRYAVAYLRIFQGTNGRFHIENLPFELRTIMRSFDWQFGKGRFYKAQIDMLVRIDFLNRSLSRRLLALSRKALALQKKAVREEFWECELFPNGNYSKHPGYE